MITVDVNSPATFFLRALDENDLASRAKRIITWAGTLLVSHIGPHSTKAWEVAFMVSLLWSLVMPKMGAGGGNATMSSAVLQALAGYRACNGE